MLPLLHCLLMVTPSLLVSLQLPSRLLQSARHCARLAVLLAALMPRLLVPCRVASAARILCPCFALRSRCAVSRPPNCSLAAGGRRLLCTGRCRGPSAPQRRAVLCCCCGIAASRPGLHAAAAGCRKQRQHGDRRPLALHRGVAARGASRRRLQRLPTLDIHGVLQPGRLSCTARGGGEGDVRECYACTCL